MARMTLTDEEWMKIEPFLPEKINKDFQEGPSPN